MQIVREGAGRGNVYGSAASQTPKADLAMFIEQHMELLCEKADRAGEENACPPQNTYQGERALAIDRVAGEILREKRDMSAAVPSRPRSLPGWPRS